MKKYKNIKTNNIAEQIGNKNSYYIKDLDLHLPKIFIEDSNDWIEIEKLEYTILSYQKTKGEFIYDLLDNGRYKLRYHKTEFPISYFDNSEDIHSIRRESDGEIFTIGKKYSFKGYEVKISILKKITIRPYSPNDVRMWTTYTQEYSDAYNLDNVIKGELKEWEITIYKVPGNEHWEVKKTLNNMWGGWSEQHKDAEVLKGNWKIKAIKRLSDNVEFKVDDKITGTYSFDETLMGYIRIQEFYFVNNKLTAKVSSGKCTIDGMDPNAKKSFKTWEHYKEAIFTTEDGVDLYDISQYRNLYGVALQASGTNILLHGYNIGIGEYIIPSSNRKWFFNKEKAEEYILMNKPCLSINDVASIYVSANRFFEDKPNSQANQLKELVKSKQSKIK